MTAWKRASRDIINSNDPNPTQRRNPYNPNPTHGRKKYLKMPRRLADWANKKAWALLLNPASPTLPHKKSKFHPVWL